MEGKGAYNKYARLPAVGAALAFPLLEKAVRNIRLDSSDQPIILADYGSSQGKNSLAPVRLAIKNLRSRAGADRSVLAYHIDQPSNDFNTLFEVVDLDQDSYVHEDSRAFPCVIGRSFYRQVLPANYVHLAWSSYAAVWLKRIPMLIPGHFIAMGSTGAVREAFASQAAKDWEAFLSLRALELRPGGRLVVVLPAVADSGLSGFEHLMDRANEVLEDMVNDGAILGQERAGMVLGSFPRHQRELTAPFSRDGQFQQLVVEDVAFFALPDSAWADYERDGDREGLAARQARFFRSIFVPSLASALGSDPERHRLFSDQFEKRLSDRLGSQPAPLHSFVQAIVLARDASQPR
jgi:hypothetical protein